MLQDVLALVEAVSRDIDHLLRVFKRDLVEMETDVADIQEDVRLGRRG
jgi:hypothetical protein